MKILDVLREQEEPATLSASEQLKDLYDKLNSDSQLKYFIHSRDENDNFINSNLTLKMEYQVLEIECTIYYTIRDFNVPNNIDNDLMVNVFKELQDYMDKNYNLNSYGDDLLNKIIFSFKEIGLFMNSNGLVGSLTLQLLKILNPIATKFSDGVPYSSLKNMDYVISRYRIPEDYTISFGDHFKERNKKIFDRIKTIYNVLKQGSVDGHTYHFKKTPWISVSPFSSYGDYSDFSKTEGNKVIPTDFNVSMSAYPSLFEIDGQDGFDVEITNPELYKKVRSHIAKLFNHHKIRDNYYGR